MLIISVTANESMARKGDDRGVINEKTLEQMKKISGVGAVTPVVTEYLSVVASKKVAQIDVIGIKPSVFEKFNLEVEEGGRMLRDSDKEMILFGNQTQYFFSDPKRDEWNMDPFPIMNQKKMFVTGDTEYGRKRRDGFQDNKEKVVYPEFKVKPIGILANPDDDSAYQAYMNIDFLEKIIKENKKAAKEPMKIGKKTYDKALVYVTDIEDSADVSKILRDMGYGTYSPSDWLEQVKETSRMIQGILGGIGGISLLVAALGITNTMIMSIYERTREIGVMKVIGANLGDIRKMFMLEAGLIGFIGGLTGLILSIIVSLLMNTVLRDIISVVFDQMMGGAEGNISKIPIWLAFASIGFATLIGLLAGYYPAKRAMQLSVLESLKNE